MIMLVRTRASPPFSKSDRFAGELVLFTLGSLLRCHPPATYLSTRRMLDRSFLPLRLSGQAPGVIALIAAIPLQALLID